MPQCLVYGCKNARQDVQFKWQDLRNMHAAAIRRTRKPIASAARRKPTRPGNPDTYFYVEALHGKKKTRPGSMDIKPLQRLELHLVAEKTRYSAWSYFAASRTSRTNPRS